MGKFILIFIGSIMLLISIGSSCSSESDKKKYNDMNMEEILIAAKNINRSYPAGECYSGDGEACTIAGVAYMAEGSHNEMYDLFFASCQFDYALGCYLVGNAQYHGLGTPKFTSRAFKSHTKSCKLGFNDACLDLKELKY